MNSKRAALGNLLTLMPSLANSAPYTSSDGHQYSLSCKKDGYVLRSLQPVSRFVEGGVSSRVVNAGHEKIYLGKDCDAFHKVCGGGKWCWANGGFLAEFPQLRIGFPRQELNCKSDVPYDLNCRC